ncbi:MAG: hypothetical protein H6828_16705, partial [Planctomycetes bacterium]|nr:hypothetical protein [Planctomycetota bacterium]
MASDPASSALATPRLEPAEGLAAWLVLLPALVLAWPLPNPIAGDFATTELSGTGVGLLA